MKFWRFKQLQPQLSVNRPVQKDDQVDQVVPKRAQPSRNRPIDRNDPLMGDDDDDYVPPQPSNDRLARDDIKQLPVRDVNSQDLKKQKKDDSDEDLTGWDT